MTAHDPCTPERPWRFPGHGVGRERCFFVHDAAPFPNAGLHMGHVRTYVLGDVTARYQRALGKDVLYYTSFDAFGLPIELAAIEQGIPPRELVARSVRRMTEQLRALGISYDWSLVACTSEPEYYRWTQWLFLEMLDAGLVERRRAPLPWCPRCETALAQVQVEEGRCWRCHTPVEARELAQWFIRISHYAGELRDTLESLDGWSSRARAMLRGLFDHAGAAGGRHGALDWLVSRQRSWGTPIPLVHCEGCGVVAVPRSELPVRLPEDLDWSSGSGALARCEEFRARECPSCGRAAQRETDTLDCFFDDIWCFLQAFVLQADPPGFTRSNLRDWLPVDRAQSGLDTFYCFHLYRFLGRFLADRGLLDDPELVRGFVGNDMVLCAGRKMSKHLGNAVSPDEILGEFGADTLRLALLWAAGPQRAVEWSRDLLLKARRFLNDARALVSDCSLAGGRPAPGGSAPGPSKAARALRRAGDRMISRVAEFIEDYRPHAALAELEQMVRRAERFASTRVRSRRLSAPDGRVLTAVLEDVVRALAPFAPHVADECWRLLGHRKPVSEEPWPVLGGSDGDRASAA